MTHTLIDLGEVPAVLEVRRRPPPYRAVLGVLSAVLLLAAGGAAYQRPPAGPTVIPARLGDTFTIDGNRLYLVGAGGVDSFGSVRDRAITSYELPSMREVSRTTVGVSGTVVSVQQAGDTVVVGYQLDASGDQVTVAYPAGGGPMLWHRPDRLVSVSSADGIVLLSADGGDVAIDLATGAERWRVSRPANGVLAETVAGTGYPQWLISLSGQGRLLAYDAHTGRRIGATTVPTGNRPIAGLIWPVGSYLLVGVGGRYDGYRVPGLERLWQTPADLSQSWMQDDCGTVICTFRQQRGMTVLDPADGQVLWSSDRWTSAGALGPHLMATGGSDEGGGARLSVLDPRTGRELGNFGDWQGLGLAPGGLIYGMIQAPGHYRLVYGLLDPADRSIEVLGSADRVSGGCETGGGVLACRLVDASVAVWRLG
ncbi:PQQ-like beta-propeller repeat protein [Actinoplanes sp. KI2]|uniref:PQQ-like beta-propeller repeat protein n=1 Tax=Actinoplanes sp. KI2 TaxID=2983315 RepID=UPI0021D5C109|nr:PQQ-like beta-propeller repeat protein [Actinoplanes sp. KI2]MCU7725844.1 PQQ-like beta-propeller repeat protein [Actinoplanes sp. KI2]